MPDPTNPARCLVGDEVKTNMAPSVDISIAKPFPQALDVLLTRARMESHDLARELEMSNDTTVRAWMEGRHTPNRHYLTALSNLAFDRKWFDLAVEFSKLKRPSASSEVPPPKGQRSHGRESTLIEVIHILDERAAEIRNDQAMFDGFLLTGMSASDIVALELDVLKASLRALPVLPRIIVPDDMQWEALYRALKYRIEKDFGIEVTTEWELGTIEGKSVPLPPSEVKLLAAKNGR